MQQVCCLKKTRVVEGSTTTMFGKECTLIKKKKKNPHLQILKRPEGVQRRIMSLFYAHELNRPGISCGGIVHVRTFHLEMGLCLVLTS